MEESIMLKSMLNILNSNSKNKKAVVDALPIVLNTYNIFEEHDIYELIVTSAHYLCFQIINPQFDNSTWKDSDVSFDHLKSLLGYFITIIKGHSNSDIIQLFQYCIELSNKIDFKDCSNEKILNIGFCMENLCTSFTHEIENCTNLNYLRNTLINLLTEPYLNKNKLDAIHLFINSIVSIDYIPVLWKNIKLMIKIYPDRVIHLLYNMQNLFFNPMCVRVILNDEDFWSLLCDLLTSENNIIRTYNNVILKLSINYTNENVNYVPSQSKEQFIKAWNDYMVVMETLENTQQHLTLPVLSTAKNLALQKNKDDYVLPMKWITAMNCKMFSHSSKHVVLTSIDIITNMPILLLKNKQLLLSFVKSLNNVFLYKMSSELCVDQPQLEIILSTWLDKLTISNDGHDIFDIFLSCIPNIKWSIVPLVFLMKSLANISLHSCLKLNIIDHILKIKSTVENMPNSYLKMIVLSFLFIFATKMFVGANTEFHCDLFDCILVYKKNTKSWDYLINSIRKINNFEHLDKQISQRLNEKDKLYSTSIGILALSNIYIDYPVSIKKLHDICTRPVDTFEIIYFLDCLLKVECHYDNYETCVSQILNDNIWTVTMIWVDKCLKISADSSYDEIICSFLDKVLISNRIVNTLKIMNVWLKKCNYIILKHSGNYYILSIYSWIGKYATRHSSEHSLKNDWLSFTKYFIDSGYFSLKNKDFFNLKKQGMHIIPQLDIVNTFFQYSTVPEKQLLDIFDWLTEKKVERNDNYWRVYFLTAKTFLSKFPIHLHLEKIIQFISDCWEFLVDCRVSCFPVTIKSFIEMAFHYNLLSEEKYVKFVENEILKNLLTAKCRDKFNVCFSLFLLKFFEKQSKVKILELHLKMSAFFAKCLLFSIERYGATKIEWDALEYIRTLKNFPLIDDVSVESLPDDRYLRFYTIQYLYKLNSNDLWKNVLTILIKTEISSRDRKFFHNSKAYRIKQRVVQVLLMIACDNQYKPVIFEENIYKWCLSSLKEVSHIHSVAYQLIWLLVLIYNNYDILSNFWNDFEKAQENHNYLCCFISIIYHLCRIKNNKQFELEAKDHLLPLCFSNGYKIRFYAQETMCKIFSCYPKESDWFLLCVSMKNIITTNEQTKKYENPFNDFFYQELDMINSLSLKNVCVEVPRLLNIMYEECFPIKWLNDFFATEIMNKNYDLSLCSVSSFIEKNTASVSTNELIVINNSQNAQRKYIPSLALDEHTTASNLIVIGSLIDKVTNLGGLARTCQVFGASTFVVDNLSCVEKKEFTALSMTAEKHQHIIEVRVKNLKSYLQKKKNEGYQIVAAEQTVDSVKLHDTELPLKCVLLLGKTRRSIASLLKLAIFCENGWKISK
ncbi:probable methyltransferase TARBP1 isoform X2 [Sipha flava]|uniref:Probable methyltransferase TARBP1 isoform X2 n=1 Tax=Sipha flava TaxID=143950 RepID=A0A8B8FKG0_9HEMI|nr:probable methyltransferase TARBP1 isoform X2 [Sipha flava]